MLLLDALIKNRDGDVYPMHMPGHKRNFSLLAMANPYGLDITEITGFDDLHAAEGILAAGMARAAMLYGSDRSFYLVNGSTCGILSAIAAATHKGDRVLVARNCHRSVYHAIGLKELEACYLLPPVNPSFGIQGSITPAAVEEALAQAGDVRLIVITSPTYEGVVSDVAAIAKLAHTRGIPLLVDAAHGAHLGFSPYFPENSVRVGADLVVHSLHKTLPALTQSALLHVNGDLVSPEEVNRQLAVFETSSPSYILMASMDACVDLLVKNKEDWFLRYEKLLHDFYLKMARLKNVAVLCPEGGAHDAIYRFDPAKIVVSVKNTDLTGPGLMKILLQRYHIEMEMALGDYALAMTGICDTKEGFLRLGDALLEIDAGVLHLPEADCPLRLDFLPIAQRTIHEAENSAGCFLPLAQTAGRISREYVYAYPPGIPMLAPGETITPALLAIFDDLAGRGVALKSTYGRMPHEIQLVV